MNTEYLLPRRCAITRRGCSTGFVINDLFIENQIDANKYCQEKFGKSFFELHEEYNTDSDEDDDCFSDSVDDFHYTEFDETTVNDQGYGFTEDGELVFVTNDLAEIISIVLSEGSRRDKVKLSYDISIYNRIELGKQSATTLSLELASMENNELNNYLLKLKDYICNSK
jgi:hypothetical protein